VSHLSQWDQRDHGGLQVLEACVHTHTHTHTCARAWVFKN